MTTDDKLRAFGAEMNALRVNARNGKLARSETVSVRLDPKLRYLADLAARKQRRPLSSFIEWALETSLNTLFLNDASGKASTIGMMAPHLWDVEAADRFAKLALRYPDLLNHTEQILWKMVRENGWLWRGRYTKGTGEFVWELDESSLMFERLREKWDLFNQVARDEQPKSALPSWEKVRKTDEENIPF